MNSIFSSITLFSSHNLVSIPSTAQECCTDSRVAPHSISAFCSAHCYIVSATLLNSYSTTLARCALLRFSEKWARLPHIFADFGQSFLLAHLYRASTHYHRTAAIAAVHLHQAVSFLRGNSSLFKMVHGF